jgi:poly-gamma-glutamate capsule biosynthesis protein CapA/YwtB (metallophosphatase superfamily)
MTSPITLSAVGDVMLARGLQRLAAEHGWDYPFDATREILKADLVFGNLEHPVSRRGTPKSAGILLRADPESVSALARAGFNVMSVANNHAMDYGPEALLDTLAILRRHGITPVGGGGSAEEAAAGAVIEVRGRRVGFLAFSVFPEAPGEGPGIAVLSDQAIVRGIRRLRARSDFVVVSAHWGFERRERVSPQQRRLGRMAIDAGASLVLGHHPHVPQEIEEYGGGLIAYSLGNFVFDRSPRGDRGIVLRCEIGGSGVTYSSIPIRIEDGQPQPTLMEGSQGAFTFGGTPEKLLKP